MNERDIIFDRKKHVLYSPELKFLIFEKLESRYSKSEVLEKWENIQSTYFEYLKDLPYLGGPKNRHNQKGGTYDCIAMMSYYKCEKECAPLNDLKFAINELYEMNNNLFVPDFQHMGKILNANNPFARKILHLAFSITSKFDKKVIDPETKKPAGYIMEVAPSQKDRVFYRFTRCPIAEFAKANGFLPIMPAFCNGDYPALAQVHASLIRNHTCANSDSCDFLIVGDKSPLAKEHPKKENDQGYFFNGKSSASPF